TCFISPHNQLAFCKFKFLPFSSMSPNERQGWEQLVCFFLVWEVLFCGKFSRNHSTMSIGAEDKASSFREANNLIATHLQELETGLPSMARIKYPTPYGPLDFASFFTFTRYNFHNKDHVDTDATTWNLVFWIPILNPLTSTENDPILADSGFHMIGGQFIFCNFQVYLDLNNVWVVTMCFFRSQDHTHQTLKRASPLWKEKLSQ
ncbi:uncharacterized protein VP01_9656g1, partial [Puccinia sorghi]